LRQTRLTVFLADRAAKQGLEGPSNPAGIGAGQVGAGDQRVSRQCPPLIGTQGRAPPLGRLPVRRLEPRPWHIDLGLAERAHQRARPAPVPVAGNASTPIGARPPIARASQHRIKLAPDQLFDE
jgi:hypothetical protein